MSKNPLGKTVKIMEVDSNLVNLFKLNEFSENIEYNHNPVWSAGDLSNEALTDQDITEMRYYISNIHDYEPQKNIMGEACYIVSKRNSYHPVKRFIESVKWDKKPRIDEWLIKSVGCDDNYYTRMASSKFLIAAVNRVYNPGCKFDHMMILEGEQSIGKSTLVEIISGDWFLDTTFEHKDKDLVDSLRNAFVVEISELSGMNKKEVDWLKSFLSRKVDRVRLPYATRSKDFKRKCVFIGTYNPSGNNNYLRDDTGNRRFWPIECKRKIDGQYLKDNVNQFWAEAYHRYTLGERYYIDNKNALKILSSLHKERELESPTQTKIKNWLTGRSETTMEDIIENCLKINMDGKNPREVLSVSTTVGIIMKKLEWRKGTNDKRNTYYKEVENVENVSRMVDGRF